MTNLIGLFEAICDASDRQDFKPSPDGTTHCNQAVHAIAYAAFSYFTFRGLTADQMSDLLRDNPDWIVIGMEAAQDYANAGSFVVAELKSTDLKQQHGHIVTIRPGLPCDSGKWGSVPRCLNIGGHNFLARSQKGPLTGAPVGVNEAFIPIPRFHVLRSSLPDIK